MADQKERKNKVVLIITSCGLALLIIGGGVYATQSNDFSRGKISTHNVAKQKKNVKQAKKNNVIDDVIKSVGEKTKDSVDQVADAFTGDTLKSAHAAVAKETDKLVEAASVIAKKPELPTDPIKDMLNKDANSSNAGEQTGGIPEKGSNGNVDTGKPGKPDPIPDPTPDPTSTPKLTVPVFATVHVHSKYDLMTGVTASDSVDGNLTNNVQTSVADLDTSKPGIKVVWYSVTNSQGVTVKRGSAISIINNAPQLNADATKVEVGHDFDPMMGVTASDTEDGDLLSRVQIISNNVKTDMPGVYKVQYRVTDQDGKVAEITRDVTVYAQTPELDVGEADTEIEVGSEFDPMHNIKASDPYDSDLEIKVEGTVDTKNVGTYVLKYSVTNHYGMSTVKTVTYHVIADQPKITGIEDKTISIGDKFDAMEGIKGVSKYGKVDITVDGEVDTKNAGEYLLTYTIKDKYSILTFNRTITVKDKD